MAQAKPKVFLRRHGRAEGYQLVVMFPGAQSREGCFPASRLELPEVFATVKAATLYSLNAYRTKPEALPG